MTSSDGRWTVSELAERAHVTVRTLHHYDEIGLLVASERSEAGYRLYSEADLERLYQVLLYRELGFTLEAIAGLLEEAPPDRLEALRGLASFVATAIRANAIRAWDEGAD